jgi:hypothetical protein
VVDVGAEGGCDAWGLFRGYLGANGYALPPGMFDLTASSVISVNLNLSYFDGAADGLFGLDMSVMRFVSIGESGSIIGGGILVGS